MSRTMKSFLMALTLSTSLFLMTGSASAQFIRSSGTSVTHTGGAAGARVYAPWRVGPVGGVAVGGATSVDHDVTRTTPLGTVTRGTEVDTARGGLAGGGLFGGYRGGFRAGSVSHSRTAVR